MTELNTIPDSHNGESLRAPKGRPVTIWRKIYKFLTSAQLAMALLVAILLCCVVGVTLIRDTRAWELIFSTLWFNSLLVMLIVNVAFCFFGRIWGRKLTLISLGMILFHLSFVTMFAGIIYNSFFYFRGTLRLTEGETLPNGQLQSYDFTERGRFFDFSRLKGETTLVKMQTGYMVYGEDKRAAYEVAIGEGSSKKQEIIYITKHLDYRGFRYFPDKEGYSVLTILHDKQGRELYGAFVSLQSLKQKDDAYLYTTGTKQGPGSFIFPQDPLKPIFALQVAYHPKPKKERTGDVSFQVWPLDKSGVPQEEKPVATGKVAVGALFDAGDYVLSVKEIRYWVGMNVRYDPGLPIVLTSLWVGLFGVTLTTLARIFGKRKMTPLPY